MTKITDLDNFSHKSIENLLNSLYHLSQTDNNKKAALQLYRFINQVLNKEQFNICERLLELIQLNRLSPELLVGLLRITYPARIRISIWAKTYDQIHQELERRELDTKTLLRGFSES